MIAVALLLFSAAFFVTGWHLLGFADSRGNGIVNAMAGTVGTVLALRVVTDSPRDPAAVAAAALVLLLSSYLLLQAAGGLYGLDPRALGMLTLFGALSLIFLVIHFFSVPVVPLGSSILLGLISALLIIAFALMFFLWGAGVRALQRVTGWVVTIESWILLALVSAWASGLLGI